LLKRFSGLKHLIEEKLAEDSGLPLLSVEREHGAEDFRNTFKILYAS
jgi:hypothetical protein